MSQRKSDYQRRPDEDYPTPPWVASVVVPYLRGARLIWEPAAGHGALADALRDEGFKVLSTRTNFLTHRSLPDTDIDVICTNPPYGANRRSDLCCGFIRHALKFPVRLVAMLLRVDFDSGKTRVDLFRDNPRFARKIVLLDRIVWFDRPGAAPSDNHAWFIFDREDRDGDPPFIHYVSKGREEK